MKSFLRKLKPNGLNSKNSFVLVVASVALIRVPGGLVEPLYVKGVTVSVKPFEIDERPVTNREFQNFIARNPKWGRDRIPRLFSDGRYLSHWSDGSFKKIQNAPVVNVSWFAAVAYCEGEGKRLPKVEEMELLAEADEDRILDWYTKPNAGRAQPVHSTHANRFGVWDVYSLVWEWTLDFDSSFVTGESRGDGSLDKSLFCGSGSEGARDPRKYAKFLRFGFRSSLKPSYTLENLGFRCAKDGT